MFKFGNRFSGAVYSKAQSFDTTKPQFVGKQGGVKTYETRAALDRYLPNNESLEAASLLDEITPQSDDGQLKLFRTIARTDAVGGPAIDLLSETPWSDGTLTGIKDKDVLDPFEQAFHMLDPQTFCPQATASYLTDGKIVASLIFDSDVGTFTDFIPQDPLFLDIEPIPVKGFDPKVNYKGNPNFKAFFKSSDERDEIARNKVPEQLVEQLSSGGKVPLEPLNTLYVPRVTSPFDWVGTSMLWRILPFYAVEKALWNASIATSRRRARSITHIKCGIQDYWEPTQQDLDAIVDLFMRSEEDPVGAYVVTRDGVETNDVRTAQDFWKLSEEWDMLTAGKTRALGLSDSLMSPDTSLANAEQGMILFYERLKVLRAELTNRIFYRKIFANIARAHGFVKKDKFETSATAVARMDKNFKEIVATGSVNCNGVYTIKGGLSLEQAYDIAYKDLLIPDINWKKQLDPQKDSTYFDMLTTLEEKGVPISKKQWAAAGGLDLQKQIEDIDEDLRMASLIQEKLRAGGAEGAGEGSGPMGGDDEGGWDDQLPGVGVGDAESSVRSVPVTGVAKVFDTLVSPSGKTTFFGVGPKKLRRAVRELFGSSLEILNDEQAVKSSLSRFYEGSTAKVEAACYLLNRAYVTDVKVSEAFLGKVAERISERMAVAKGQDLKNLVAERNFVYSQYMKHRPKQKAALHIPKNCPDRLTGAHMYSGIPQA